MLYFRIRFLLIGLFIAVGFALLYLMGIWAAIPSFTAALVLIISFFILGTVGPAFTKLIKFTIGNLVEILGQELQTLTENQENIYYNGNVITIKNWTKELNLPNRPSYFFSDGVHPSKLTYQVWAKDFTNFILKQSKIKDALINPS